MTVRLKPACGFAAVILVFAGAADAQSVLTGPAAFGDFTADKPGLTRKISPGDLPPPDMSGPPKIYPKVAAQVTGDQMQVLPGFTVAQYGEALQGPRALSVAPNGDIFVSEGLAGRVRVLRPGANGAAPASVETFAEGLTGPFGVAFYPAADPRWVYVAETNTVKRFPYRAGDMKARAESQVVVAELSATTGGHITRDLDFTADGRRMLVSVGSQSNFTKLTPKTPAEIAAFEREHGVGASWDNEVGRGVVMSFTPEGQDRKPFATGLRNCVSLKRNPATGDFYCTVNERDALGNNLAPDYFTRVKEGSFHGFPWFYTGENEEPRIPVEDRRPDLKGKVTVPDVLFQPHSAPIEAAFYPANIAGPGAFPAEYRGDAFVALHGSQNRSTRTGHKIVRIKLKDGVPTGEYQDFVTGLVLDTVNVLGRPSGLVVLKDGSLLFSDDVGGRLWRVSYTGR